MNSLSWKGFSDESSGSAAGAEALLPAPLIDVVATVASSRNGFSVESNIGRGMSDVPRSVGSSACEEFGWDVTVYRDLHTPKLTRLSRLGRENIPFRCNTAKLWTWCAGRRTARRTFSARLVAVVRTYPVSFCKARRYASFCADFEGVLCASLLGAEDRIIWRSLPKWACLRSRFVLIEWFRECGFVGCIPFDLGLLLSTFLLRPLQFFLLNDSADLLT